MNRVITLFLFFLSFTTFGQGVLNKGAYIIISPSTSVTITGSSGNFNNGSSSVTELNGSLYLQGDFTNNGSFNSTSGVITFNGNNDQIAGGNSTTFYNLVDSNFYQLLINMPVLHVKNQLSLKGNKIFLQNNEIKLGSYGSPPTPGILIRTSGWFYGQGKFTRWFSRFTPHFSAGNINGLFPFGDSATNYHPFWFGSATDIANSGTISVYHNPYCTGSVPTSYTDASWSNSVIARSKAGWKVVPDSGFSLGNGVTSAEISFGGDGFIPFVSTDINASLSNGTFGIYVPPYVNGSYFEVQRRGIDDMHLNQTWYVGTRNTSITPLPVELLSFSGACHNSIVTLQWSTASESNNSHFTVERSQDALNWIAIAEIPGWGNSNQLKNYHYSDENYSDFAVYYRLKQTDFDGKISYFSPIAVNCASGEDKIEVDVFPVPFERMVTVRLHNFISNDAVISVSDVIGNKITEQRFSEIQNHEISTVFDLGDLADGMYFIEITSAGYSKNVKIIKN